jgi:hypothetical protein
MAQLRGLWIAIAGKSLSEAVAYSIETQDQFTIPVTTRDVRPRRAERVIVSLKDNIADFIGISQGGRQIATGQMTLVISRLVPLPRMTTDDIRKALPRRFAHRFKPPTAGQYRPSPGLWEELLKVFASKDSDIATRLRDLSNIVRDSQSSWGPVRGGFEIFERDAIASALETWRGAPFRKRMLRSVSPATEDVPVASFLSQLAGTSVREDPQISHDHTTFPGMEVARRDQVGSLVLRDRNEYLTILNCNRQPLEQTLGVDLIYYSHRFDSFVLVQYKRMTQGKHGEPVYRPNLDKSHAEELKRMIATNKLLQSLPRSDNSEVGAFRLSSGPFYVKICEPKTKSALDAGMVSGMYVPLALWRRLLKSDHVRSPLGAVRITWDNCSRRFNNTEFTNLLRHGWIGSATGRSKRLSQIIEEVLASGIMLVFAATTGGPASQNFRRDTYGRFAADDDPAGST